MKRVVAIFGLALALVLSVDAKPKDKRARGGAAMFGPADTEVIVGYYRGDYRGASGLPPGLAKRGGNLPPGLEKQLRRNGRLPPGLEKKIAVFPEDLERRLPPLAPGLCRGLYEGRAVIYNPRTRVVLDVMIVR